MVRRQASKSRGRPRTKRSGGVKKSGKGKGSSSKKAGAFLRFVSSMRDLFPGKSPGQLTHDSKAIWREMNSEDKSMYAGSSGAKALCGPDLSSIRPGRMGRRRRSRGRSRSRSRSRSKRRSSRSRSRSRSRRRRPGR